MVSPEGNIYFCPVHKNKIAGNLRKSTFDGIWKSREAEDIRNFFDQRRCHCWLTCTNGYMLEKALADGKQSFINTFFNKR
jgi:radical SAM protein with 4Fe4S-binding SPASM domain